MPTDIETFSRRMKRASKWIPQSQLLVFQKKIAMELLRRVVMKTPVDTGRARGNWQLTIDTAASEAVELVMGDSAFNKGGSVSQAHLNDTVFNKARERLAALKPFRTVYIQNNVEYIEFLEDGSSSQAPAGMLKLALEEVGGNL